MTNKIKYTNELCIFFVTTLNEYYLGSLNETLSNYCTNIKSEYKFDIILYFDNFPKRFRKFNRELNKFRKFSNVNKVILVNNNISNEENFYEINSGNLIDINKFPLGSSHGVNKHFYETIDDLYKRDYNNFMLLETDTKAMKDNWFDTLHNYCINNEFSIAGSKYKGKQKEEVYKTYHGGSHINGVALYKNNKATLNLIKKSKSFLINSLIKDSTKSKRHKKCNGCMNYDVAIYLYSKKKKNTKMLHNTNFITNFSLKVNDYINETEIMSEYPDTCILHKKNLYKEDIKECDKIKILKQNKVYRIADLFYMDGNRWQKDRFEIVDNKKYKNTILYDYLTFKQTEKDFELFKKITLNHSKKYLNKPSDDDLVFHLRLGDVFDINGETRIYNRADWSYLQYKVFFRRNREYLETLDKVKVVTAMHFGSDELTGDFHYTDEYYKESIKFFDYFCGRLNDFGCGVEVISNENIDEDICYLMQAKHFVPGLTKLSTLISECLGDNVKLYRDPIKKYI